VFALAGLGMRGSERSNMPLLSALRIGNGGAPFAGDRHLLTTLSPNGDELRDAAIVWFRLSRPARVRLQVLKTTDRAHPPRLVWQTSRALEGGSRHLVWRPRRTITPRTYVLQLSATDASGASQVVTGPIVRVLGIDAGFTRPSYPPEARASLVVATDSSSLVLQMFHAGPETSPGSRHVPPRGGWVPLYAGYRSDELHGLPVGPERRITWSSRRRPATLRVDVPNAPSGLYFLRLKADDGRVGFAPFVLLPHPLGRHRVAVLLPTNTWEAYNHRDVDGDGWGDTWYAVNSINRVDLTRAYLHRGVPTRFLGYQLGFLRWLYQTKRQVDFLSDAELEHVSGRTLFGLVRPSRLPRSPRIHDRQCI
jgi:hypothetical protein